MEPKVKYMNEEHIKGAADKAKGAVKDAVGGLTGKPGLQVEGKIDKAKGTAHEVAGDIKMPPRTGVARSVCCDCSAVPRTGALLAAAVVPNYAIP